MCLCTRKMYHKSKWQTEREVNTMLRYRLLRVTKKINVSCHGGKKGVMAVKKEAWQKSLAESQP